MTIAELFERLEKLGREYELHDGCASNLRDLADELRQLAEVAGGEANALDEARER